MVSFISFITFRSLTISNSQHFQFTARSWAWGAVAYRCQTHPGEASAVDYLGDNALHWASFGRPPLEAVEQLLKADPTLAQVANKKGHLPLHVASSYKATPQVLRAILNAYPQAAGIPTHSGSYPLHLYCDFGGTLDALRILLESPAARDTLHLLDGLYQRRPLEIMNARKNRAEFSQALQIMRRARQRQAALYQDIDRGVVAREVVQEDLEILDDTVHAYQCMDFWKKPALLIYAEYTGEPPLVRTREEDEEELVVTGPEILMATVANPQCPEVLQEFSVLLHYPILLQPLDDHGNLPLHVAAQFGNASVVVELVNAFPVAASVRNHDGLFPLSLWLQRPDKTQVPSRLLEAYPAALVDEGLDQRLYPYIWSRLSTPDPLFHSLRAQPDLLVSNIRWTMAEI